MSGLLASALLVLGAQARGLPVFAQTVREQVTHTYAPSDDDFPNPERGLVLFVKMAEEKDLGWVRAKGMSLLYWGVSLSAFRAAPLDAPFLAKLDQGFQKARAAGLKIVLRFAYTEKLGDPDAPISWVLRHIDQLKPALQANADVIAVVQAGFAGAWGEWHGSTNGLEDPSARKDILTALLGAVPASRSVQVRAPRYKTKLFGPAPVSDAEAFKGGARARLGHHNDAIFSDPNDMGTFEEPVKASKEWLTLETRFVPMGGETTGGPPRGGAPEFLAELEKLHCSFLHFRYPEAIRKQWEAQGLYAAFRRRLGYRFSLLEASWPSAVRPGGELRLAIRLRNGGVAALFNKRPLEVVLSNDRTHHVAKIASIDPRRWNPAEEAKFTLKLAVPGSATPGAYRLALALPDDSASLASRPEYAVRFANEKVWDASSGANVLGSVKVDAFAPGLADSRIKEFSEIP